MNMKRNLICTLLVGLFITACNDVDMPIQSGVENAIGW